MRLHFLVSALSWLHETSPIHKTRIAEWNRRPREVETILIVVLHEDGRFEALQEGGVSVQPAVTVEGWDAMSGLRNTNQ